MTDTVRRAERSRIMGLVRSEDTIPELKVRKALHAAGFRFRLHVRDMPGTPDVVLPKYRTVVFVHGCFWHWHGCRRSRMPTSNVEYWQRKISGNVSRDSNHVRDLRQMGWRVEVVWECNIGDGVGELIHELRQHQAPAGVV